MNRNYTYVEKRDCKKIGVDTTLGFYAISTVEANGRVLDGGRMDFLRVFEYVDLYYNNHR